MKRLLELTKLWLTWSRKEERRQSINQGRNKRDLTADATDTRKIIRGYCEDFSANKFEYLNEMNKFLKKYNLPQKK